MHKVLIHLCFYVRVQSLGILSGSYNMVWSDKNCQINISFIQFAIEVARLQDFILIFSEVRFI